MATGAGKTFTAVTTTYRLLKLRAAPAVSCSWSTATTSASRPSASSRNYVTPDDGASSPSSTASSG